MSFITKKIPALKAGLARIALQFLLSQVKNQRGLTTFIEKHGINGKWLKPDEPMDISVTKFFKIMAYKAHFQTDEEFIADWNEAGKEFLQWVRKGERPLPNLPKGEGNKS